jgi:hypothetical protein
MSCARRLRDGLRSLTTLPSDLCSLSSSPIGCGDPLWAFVVGPSGSSKTELVNPLTTLEFVRPLDQLTTNTFLSGKQRKDPNASIALAAPLRGDPAHTRLLVNLRHAPRETRRNL